MELVSVNPAIAVHAIAPEVRTESGVGSSEFHLGRFIVIVPVEGIVFVSVKAVVSTSLDPTISFAEVRVAVKVPGEAVTVND